MSFYKWLMRRECGYRPQFGDQDFLWQSVYNSIEPFVHWTDINHKTRATSDHGAVFNLEFSPEGNIVVAACEKKSVLILDSSTTQKVNQITDAHQDSVNCIRFLDKRMFATCSDDTTIALWDLRNLKTKIRSLNGHSNWVKNIEYSPKDSLLVTSAFDGSIYTWDINSQTEQGLIHNNVFHTSGLMRCRISPDGTKLVICTTGGYLMIIHDLDLTTLQKDLAGFRPSIYRLMQMGEQYIPQAAKFDHVFSKQQKKNRVELVTDFPERNDAEVVMSLQIHPEGHSFLSRNISQSEDTEWSCVHSIRDEPGDITDQLKMPQTKRKRKYTSESGEQAPDPEHLDGTSIDNEAEGSSGAASAGDGDQRTRTPRTSRGSARAASVRIEPMMNLPNDSFVPDIWAAEVTLQERAMRQNRTRGTVNGYNFVYAISSGVLPARFTTSRTQSPVSRQELSRIVLTGLSGQRGSGGGSSTSEAAAAAAAAATERDADADVDAEFSLNSSSSSNSSNSSTTSSHSNSSSSSDSRAHPTEARLISTSSMPGNGRLRIYQLKRRNSNAPRIKIFQNAKKLMYYKQESTVGKGFIKESCYSADGRIIASPYSNGIRLLAYNEQCSEYPTYEVDKLGTRESQELVLIKQMTVSHKKDIVLCSKFSPFEPLLVSGCQSGKIVWYHPNL